MKSAHRQRAAAHLDRLCYEHKIDARGATRLTAESNTRERMIFVPALVDVCDYLIALHEIGHIVDPQARGWGDRVLGATFHPKDTKSKDLYPVMMMEMAAWAWAHQTAKRSLLSAATDADWQVIADCLVSWFR